MARNSVCKKIRPTQKNYLNEYLKVRTGLGLIEKTNIVFAMFFAKALTFFLIGRNP